MNHRVWTDETCSYWECSCGRAGSVGSDGDVDLHSDRHIDYAGGETRTDVRSPLDL